MTAFHRDIRLVEIKIQSRFLSELILDGFIINASSPPVRPDNLVGIKKEFRVRLERSNHQRGSETHEHVITVEPSIAPNTETFPVSSPRRIQRDSS